MVLRSILAARCSGRRVAIYVRPRARAAFTAPHRAIPPSASHATHTNILFGHPRIAPARESALCCASTPHRLTFNLAPSSQSNLMALSLLAAAALSEYSPAFLWSPTASATDAAGGELVGDLDPLPRGGQSEIVRSAEPLRSEGSEGQPSSAEVG